MNKGLAVPYIIALILGVIILAVAAYLVYKSVWGSKLDCQECKAKFTTWCSICYLADWDKEYNLGDLSECVDECGYWPGATAGKDCKTDSVEAKEACSGMGVPF